MTPAATKDGPAAAPAPAAPAAAKPAQPAGQRLRLVCSNCKTLCEVMIPASAAPTPKQVRYQVRCPNCKAINDPSTQAAANGDAKRKVQLKPKPATTCCAQESTPRPPLPLPPLRPQTHLRRAPHDSAVVQAPAPAASQPPAKRPNSEPAGGPQKPTPPNRVYQVERIMAQRERKPGGKLEYHIKWLGYDNSHNSWEPASNILDPKLLEKWRQQQVCATPCQVGANHARLTHATPRHATLCRRPAEPARAAARRRAWRPRPRARAPGEPPISQPCPPCSPPSLTHSPPPISAGTCPLAVSLATDSPPVATLQEIRQAIQAGTPRFGLQHQTECRACAQQRQHGRDGGCGHPRGPVA